MGKGDDIGNMFARHGLEATQAKLHVLTLDQTRMPCSSWPGPFQPQSTLLIEVLEQIEERALRQANVLGGSHAFMLELVGLVDGKPATLATEFFRVSAEALPNGPTGSEPPNEGGLVAQMMRHTENYFRIATSSWQRSEATLTRQNETLAKQNDTLMQRLHDQSEMVRTAVMGDREHELALEKTKARNKVFAQVAEQVTNLLPEVASMVVKKTTGSAAGAAAVGIKGFIATLKPGQLERIASQLEPEQQIALFSAMKNLAEDHEKKNPPPPEPPAGTNGHDLSKTSSH